MKITDLKGKKVAVLGLRNTGPHLVEHLSKMGCQIVSAKGDLAKGSSLERVKDFDIQWIDPYRQAKKLLECDAVIQTIAHEKVDRLTEELKKRGVQVTYILDLIGESFSGMKIAVTGTNGKSTICDMMRQIFEAAGISCLHMGGHHANIMEAVQNPKLEVGIFECRSNRLGRSETFHPHISVISNISWNHPERHQRFSRYGKAKLKIFQNQTKEDYLIHGYWLPILPEKIEELNPPVKKIPVDSRKCLKEGLSFKDGKAYLRFGKKDYIFDLKAFRLKGPHNVENFLCAAGACLLAGVDPKIIEGLIPKFRSLPYRLQYIGKYNGVRYYNDGMADNIHATLMTLLGLRKNIFLIFGGYWQVGMHYEVLKDHLKQRVKVLVLFGEDRKRFYEVFQGQTEIYLVETLQEAVDLCLQKAVQGDSVVFSPGTTCDSAELAGNRRENSESFNEVTKELISFEKMQKKLQRSYSKI